MSDTTCTHHNDAERTACPVCLVAALTAERDELRALLVYTDQLHDEALDDIISERDQLRAEVERAVLKETGYLKAMVQDGTNAMKERDRLRAENATLRAELATERAKVWTLHEALAILTLRWDRLQKERDVDRADIDAAMKERAK